MYEPNAVQILAMLPDDGIVVDVGGWARPFNRANWVVDVEPYATRGWLGLAPQGGERECFSEQTWIQRDVCDRTPFPFADKSVDFVICSHLLEDVRDPLWVCSELSRIARRGYVEVPSRVAESCRGIEPGQVGWSHHRWLIDIGDGAITFLMKYHTIHSHWRLSLPRSYYRRMDESARVQWLFWEDGLRAQERLIHGPENIRRELEAFVGAVRPYSRARLVADAAARAAVAFPGRVARRLLRVVRG